jgi:toxin ParE1/3/4
VFPVYVRREAELDLIDAYCWYEERRAGLGAAFLLSVEAAVALIRRFPESHPNVHKDVRRVLTRRFPYGVFYVVERERIVVIAVFHAKRDPRRWQARARG